MATMAIAVSSTLAAGSSPALSRSMSACISSPLVSQFCGSKLPSTSPRKSELRSQALLRNICATAVVETSVKRPTWSSFEMGRHPVYWETVNGRPPTAGEALSIYFNPASSNLQPELEYGVGFNGGFNQPIMCGGEPRLMTRRDRGVKCEPFYVININVPLHALNIEFSFTDGKDWTQSYKILFEVPKKFKNKPESFFNEELAKELSQEGACMKAIFPDAVLFQDRCAVAGLYHEVGYRCELDLVPGCTDPENPFYNPLANVDDGSCVLFPSEDENDQ